jgi:hypothetical protein
MVLCDAYSCWPVALGQVAVVAHEPPGDVQQGGVTATAARLLGLL